MNGPTQQFGKVAVLMGGWSPEREVSLQSGAAVLEALRRGGVDATGIDLNREKLLSLRAEGYDRAFIALHGEGGEDGLVQAVLEAQQLPYTGSRVLASALAMDKARCKSLWASMGVPTPPHRVIHEQTDFDALVGDLGLPLFVKPAQEGSSLGLSRVNTVNELPAAWRKAAELDDVVLAERYIDGPEYTAAILDGRVLPLLRIEPAGDFYDYHAKYVSDDTRYVCPCGLPEDQEQNLARLCARAFEAIGGRGWGRVDFMLDASGQPWFLEVNTVPGMTSHSLVPMCAQADGIDFDTLVRRILATSLNSPANKETSP
ncbi:MAG: D-alanine--D-alanine ligase [Salinisphaeraceae bacterium]|nr:D-alanine--D-alanine ligase [Salinisphaeraceae bacterium]